ncbi:MAG: class I SAM-dependent methyltransferase [Pseudomonadota bacterium]
MSLFKKIEALQGHAPWGHMLDAGTGPKSLSWIASLKTQRWTAVTAQRAMIESTRQALSTEPRAGDRLILGNWADDSLLNDEQFDTVLLDYFVGAIEAFAPYMQETLLHRVAARAKGALYVIGLEPYVPITAEDEVGEFIGDLGRFRDACMLLARDRPYREYPGEWVAAQLRLAGMRVTHIKFFSIRYRGRFLASQLNICEQRAHRIPDSTLAAAVRDKIERLRDRGEALIEQHDGLRYGRDYVLRAEPSN